MRDFQVYARQCHSNRSQTNFVGCCAVSVCQKTAWHFCVLHRKRQQSGKTGKNAPDLRYRLSFSATKNCGLMCLFCRDLCSKEDEKSL